LPESLSQFLAQWSLRDLLDVALVALCVYRLLLAIHGTRAVQILQGVAVLLLLLLLAQIARLQTLTWVLTGLLASAAVALPVVFQPELRRALMRLGQQGLLSSLRAHRPRPDEIEQVAEEVALAAASLSRCRYGALMVLEQRTGLEDYIERGHRIEGRVTAKLLRSVFQPGTPLHDGAVIIRGGQVVAAKVWLSLSEQQVEGLGMRHRAALGLSEQSDAIVVVVSEETGQVRLAHEGKLTLVPADESEIKRALMAMMVPPRLPAPSSLAMRTAWLTGNVRLKWLSLVVAVGLLLMAKVTGGYPARVEAQKMLEVKVQPTHYDRSLLTASVLPDRVWVTVRGERAVIEQLRPDSLNVVVDLSDRGPGNYWLAVRSVVSGVDVVRIDPSQVAVKVSALELKQVPVSLTVLGAPAQGYQAGPPRVHPPRVSLRGPADVLAEIVEVRGVVQLPPGTRVDESGRLRTRDLALVDARGMDVEGDGHEIEPAFVDYTVPVIATGRVFGVPVDLGNVRAQLASYTLEARPPTVTLRGELPGPEAQTPLTVLTERFTFKASTGPQKQVLRLLVPEGYTVVGSDKVEVTMTPGKPKPPAGTVQGASRGHAASPPPD
jgi:diadenylate cyclase